jgi:hypothetical protein
MEHHISLTVKSKDAGKSLAKLWYGTAVAHLPEGLASTVQTGDTTARMKMSKKGEKVTLSIPLVRNLTAKEVETVIGEFDAKFSKDFVITSTRVEIGLKDEVEVEVPHEPIVALCTAWAKSQHDEWVKDKTDSGWRYGPSVSVSNKTHPLLRPWADLPETYRKVDTTKVEEMLKLMNDHGYVMIAKTELDNLLK